MTPLIHLISAILTAHIGTATTFSSNDPSNPDPRLYCTNRVLNDRTDFVVAHPTLPCGSRVYIYSLRTKRSVYAYVADRGPRHALIDLSPAVAKQLQSNGFEQVILIPVRSK